MRVLTIVPKWTVLPVLSWGVLPPVLKFFNNPLFYKHFYCTFCNPVTGLQCCKYFCISLVGIGLIGYHCTKISITRQHITQIYIFWTFAIYIYIQLIKIQSRIFSSHQKGVEQQDLNIKTRVSRPFYSSVVSINMFVKSVHIYV